MSYVIDLQALDSTEIESARTITSSVSLALCGSTISAFWC